MKRASVLFFCCLFVCLTAVSAQAGGFALYEWGNRSIGMATSNYAVGNDASVIAYNPALMTQFTDVEILAGFAAVAPSAEVDITGHGASGSNGNFKTTDQTFMVPHAYLVAPYSDNISLGIGVFTRYGLGTKYDDDWGGKTMLQEIMLESYSVQPTIAFKLTDKLSIGAGPEIIKGSLELKKAIPNAVGGGTAKVSVDGVSVGGVAAMHYAFDDNWSLGFTYRTPVQFTANGDVAIEDTLGPLNSGDAKVKATFPDSYTLGLGYEATDWTVEASVIHTRWEKFDYMDFEYGANTNLTDNSEEFYYKNTWRMQLGGEYLLSEMVALRAGFAYDQTPTRHGYTSPMLPANDRMLYSLGLGFKGERWTCDLSGMYITTKERHGMSKDVDFDGTYEYDFTNGKTMIFGISGGYAF